MRGGLADGGQGPPPEQRQAARQSCTQKVGRGHRTHGIPAQMLAGTGTEQPESQTAPSFRWGQLLCPVSAQVCRGTKQGSKRGDKVGLFFLEVLHLEQLCPGHQGAKGEGQPRGAEKGLQEDLGQPQRATLILQAGEGGTRAPPRCGGSSDAPHFGDAEFGRAQTMPLAGHPRLELMSPCSQASPPRAPEGHHQCSPRPGVCILLLQKLTAPHTLLRNLQEEGPFSTADQFTPLCSELDSWLFYTMGYELILTYLLHCSDHCGSGRWEGPLVLRPPPHTPPSRRRGS